MQIEVDEVEASAVSPTAVVDHITEAIREIARKLLRVAGVENAPEVLASYNLIPGWAPKGARTRVKGQTDMKQPFWIEPAPRGQGGAKYLTMVSWDTLATGDAPAIVSTIAHAMATAEAAIPDPKKPSALKFYPAGWGQVAKRYGLTGEAKDKYALTQTPERLLDDDNIVQDCELLAGLVAEAVGKGKPKAETHKFSLVFEGIEKPFSFRQSGEAGKRLLEALKSGATFSIKPEEAEAAPEVEEAVNS